MGQESQQIDLEERIRVLEKEAALRKAVEGELYNQKELLDKILDASLIGMMLFENRVIVWANRVAVEMFGYMDERQLIGKGSEVLYASESEFKRAGDIIYDSMKRGDPAELDILCRRGDKTEFVAHVKARAFDRKDPKKKAVAAFSDITEQKRLQRQLSFQKAYFESLFTNLPEAAAVFDESGLITAANPEFLRLFGYSTEEIMGRDISRIVAPPDRIEEATAIRKRISSGEMINTETVRMKRDGTIIDVSLLSAPVIIEDRLIGHYIIYRDISGLKETERKLKELATTDPLTGILNRRRFRELARKELVRSMRYQRPLSLVMFDIDRFKSVNDTYGHDVGDGVLQHLVKIIGKGMRESDIFGRWGGEEFALLLPDTDSEGSHRLAERLRMEVEASPFSLEDGLIHFTVSGGVASVSPGKKSIDKLFREADEALYSAKRGGRNMVSIFSPSS